MITEVTQDALKPCEGVRCTWLKPEHFIVRVRG
jgi:hypothetical protein